MHPPAAAPWCRVSVLAPRGRVDVALPGDVPVGELVPMLLELVGEPVRGGPAAPWRLCGVGGGPLPTRATLDELGVLDGELLRVGPDAPPPPPPVFDDPADAVAHGSGDGQPVPAPPGRGALALVGVGAALLAWAGTTPDGTGSAVITTLAVLAALTGLGTAVVLARTAGGPAPLARISAQSAVPLAAAAGWAAVAGGPAPARLVLAVAAAGTAAALGLVALRVAAPALVAVVVAAVPVGVAAALHLRLGWSPPALAAGLAAVAMVAGPLLPRVALRLSGLPLPVIPADSTELAHPDAARSGMSPAELTSRAALARAQLAGLVAGVSTPAALAAPVLAADGGWAGPLLAGLVVTVLGLRARGYADAGPRRTLLLSAAAGGTALATVVALGADPVGRVGVALAVLAAAGVAAGLERRTTPFGSPVARRAIDIVEGVLVAVSVPLALGVLGVYELVRGL